MPPKIANASVDSEAGRAYAASVRDVAVRWALENWYAVGYRRANSDTPGLQRESNEKEFGRITPENAYVVLLRMFSGTLQPLTLSLDGAGGLTYRQLHRQVRAHLEIDAKHSLRICSWRPWYRFITDELLPPERRALPADDGQCQDIFGTTIVHCAYIHLDAA
jgi:hypothetical protein